MSFHGTRAALTPPQPDRPRNSRRGSVGLLLLLFLFNLVWGGFLASSHDKASGDALSYYALAVNLSEGEGFTRDYKSDPGTPETEPPFSNQGRFLYPYLVSLTFPLAGKTIETANCVAALFRALLVIPLVLITWQLFDDRAAGWAAGLLYTFNPVYLALGTIAMPETTTAAFYYFGILCFLYYGQTARGPWLLLGGAAASLSYLARPEGLLLVLLGLLTVAFGPRRPRDVAYLLFFPVVTLTVGSLLIYGKAGNVSPYQTSLTTLPDWADYYVLGGWTLSEYLDRVGGIWGTLTLRVYNLLLFLRNTFSDGLFLTRRVGLLPFTAILPMIVSLRRPLRQEKRGYLYLLTAFMVVQFVATIGYPGYPRMSADYRHGQIIGPFLIILTAVGLVHLWRGCAGVARRAPASTVCTAFGGLLTLHLLAFSVVFISIEVNDLLWVPRVRDPLVQGSEWIRDNLPQEAVIMTRKPVVVNHVSGRTAVIIPTATYAQIMDYARRHSGTHFLLTDLELNGLPNLRQGLEVYADHFRRVCTAEEFSVIAVKSYEYDSTPAVEDDWYVGPENAPGRLFDWHDLWDFPGSDALDEVREIWSEWSIRAQKGIWRPAKGGPGTSRPQHEISARLGAHVALRGYDLNREHLVPGGTLELTLHWQALDTAPMSYTVFTHLLDPSGLVRTGQDNPPLRGARPTDRWDPGEIVRDRYRLTLDADAPPGEYRIEIGMYDPLTAQRLPAYGEGNEPLSNRRILLGPITVR